MTHPLHVTQPDQRETLAGLHDSCQAGQGCSGRNAAELQGFSAGAGDAGEARGPDCAASRRWLHPQMALKQPDCATLLLREAPREQGTHAPPGSMQMHRCDTRRAWHANLINSSWLHQHRPWRCTLNPRP